MHRYAPSPDTILEVVSRIWEIGTPGIKAKYGRPPATAFVARAAFVHLLSIRGRLNRKEMLKHVPHAERSICRLLKCAHDALNYDPDFNERMMKAEMELIAHELTNSTGEAWRVLPAESL